MDNAQVAFDKAIELENEGEQYKAELLLKEITDQYREYSDMDLVYIKLGVYSYMKKDFNTAIMYFEKALNINPHSYISYKCMGLVYRDIKDYHKAIECFEKYLLNNETDIESIYDLANCNIQLMNWEQALVWCEKVKKIECNYEKIDLFNGIVNEKLGKMKEAKHYYEKQLRKTPNCVHTLISIARFLAGIGYSEQSVVFFKRMLKNINKDDYKYFSNYLFSLNYTLLFDDEFIFNEHRRINEFLKIIPNDKFNNDLNPNKKLKIGYVSGDFKLHSVAYFIISQLAFYNKENFEVFCYSTNKYSDFVTDQIKSYVDKYKQIEDLNNEEVFNLFVEDEIDILVDLSGYTAKNRLPVFAMKPVPIQITAIGYPNTTGIKGIDYRITDCYCDEEGINDKYYTEKLIRMDKSFLCYRNFEGAPEVKKNNDKDEIVFGSYNSINKLTNEMVKTWSEILIKVSKSKLVLKSKIFSDEEIAEEIKKRFIDNGVEEQQINLIAQHQTTKEHLNSYNEIDIALDSFPYNGTTTTFEAMYMGVPVITLAGKRHASRVGVSILSNVGLNELITYSTQEYVEKAVELAKDREQIKFFYENLRGIMLKSPLMDSVNYVKELEKIFRQLWIKWSKEQWQKIICSNSSIVEKIIHVLNGICEILADFNNIDYNTCPKDYIINLVNKMLKEIVVLFENTISLKVNDTELNELINNIIAGANILVNAVSMDDSYQIQEVIATVMTTSINKLNEKFMVNCDNINFLIEGEKNEQLE